MIVISRDFEGTFIHRIYVFAIIQGVPVSQNNSAVIVFNLSHDSLAIVPWSTDGLRFSRTFERFERQN